MGKWTDKDYITYTEWTEIFGGCKKARTDSGAEFKPLPFDCCALTLVPYSTPVCTREGIIFDLLAIVPYLQKRGVNPVTGEPLDPKSLVRLCISKNGAGEYYCPVTLRTFGQHSHIVANAKTGQVYSMEAIERMVIDTVKREAVKPLSDLVTKDKEGTRETEKSSWKDIMTNEPFSRKDLITLQDPKNPKNIALFKHVVEAREALAPPPTNIFDTIPISSKQNRNDGGTLVESKTGPNSLLESEIYTKGRVAASLTSTAMTPVTINEMASVEEEAEMFRQLRGTKQVVKMLMRTNLGDMVFELWIGKAPKACFNFIRLAQRGYYADTIFHRLIPGFMVQGGDPSGTGSGGQSIWEKPFEDELCTSESIVGGGPTGHFKRGILGMANKRKPNTNSSQFYITFSSQPHLDGAHTIFGHLIDGTDVLDKIEAVPVASDAKPINPIRLVDMVVVQSRKKGEGQEEAREDPYEQWKRKRRQALGHVNDARARLDPTLVVKRARASVNNSLTIGKYIKKS